ncbi:MAG: hypothetical protein JWL98_1452, partial [Xanthomonadaceae bacterium]|nr:hypothetical protein [Xanthomonadaceae bacterium]
NGVGDAAGARAAQARADEARLRVRSLVPKALQPGFDAAETVGAPARGTP